ncbi:Conidiation protein 6-domain-containing protein [Irpex rosettiformis]|uniref:Conidiation protein 6-domain-containing protein n=1 Tax=Irpex rosettiformis TaxID=378272 RepID=A0ACB8TV51_9APHY|nr:Conidiation protein 6-domain-containing protein [Irpex rosettiformis]
MADSNTLPTRVIGGHKANLNNPRNSEESKEHSRQVISELENDPATKAQQEQYGGEKNEGNVIGGHKATLKNPNVSEEAKEHSRSFLEDKGAF